MDGEDAALCLLIGQGEFYLTVNTPGSDQSRVKGLDTVSGHDHLEKVAFKLVVVGVYKIRIHIKYYANNISFN